ncbi:DUF2029 domain-containing protein [Candidatus Peregrinibacteria bacterium]|nr:DUF2029 domain-containing protein [Candidatus Peregrinibacteria bacterium]
MQRVFIAGFLTALFIGAFAVVTMQTRITMGPFVRIGMQVRDLKSGTIAELRSEYPPLASALFYIFQENPFRVSFNNTWKGFLLLTIVLSCLWTFLTGSRRKAALLPAALLLCIPLLGNELMLARYDILIALLLFLTWQSWERNRHFLAGVSLGLSASLKIVPILVLPFLWLQSPNDKRSGVLLGCIGGLFLGIAIPLLIIGPQAVVANVSYMLSYHEVRGIQVESSWAGALLLWSAISGTILTIDSTAQAYEITGHPILAIIASVTTVAGLIFLFFRNKSEKQNMRSAFDPSFLFLPLLWVLFTTPVLSPQYFVWIIPLLLVYDAEQLLNNPRRILPWLLPGLTIVTAALTHWIYPVLYDDLLHFRSFLAVIVLNLRNLCIAGLIAILYLNKKIITRG